MSLTDISTVANLALLGDARALEARLNAVCSREQLPALCHDIAEFAARRKTGGRTILLRLIDLLECHDAQRTYALREEILTFAEDQDLAQIQANVQTLMRYIVVALGEERLAWLATEVFATQPATVRRWFKGQSGAQWHNESKMKGIASAIYFMRPLVGSGDPLFECLNTPAEELAGDTPFDRARHPADLVKFGRARFRALRDDPLREAAQSTAAEQPKREKISPELSENGSALDALLSGACS